MGVLASPGLAQGATHPDAELLAAWEQWLATYRACYADRLNDDEFDATIDGLEAIIGALPATTSAGVAVKL